MKNKSILSLVLALCLALSAFTPLAVFASEEEPITIAGFTALEEDVKAQEVEVGEEPNLPPALEVSLQANDGEEPQTTTVNATWNSVNETPFDKEKVGEYTLAPTLENANIVDGAILPTITVNVVPKEESVESVQSIQATQEPQQRQNAVTTAAGEEKFSFQVTTTTPNETFAIPLSGKVGADPNNPNNNYNKPYNWNILWGDEVVPATPTNFNNTTGNPNSANSDGIPHTYKSAGTYTITITPADANPQAWLGAFGFDYNSAGANNNTNRAKLTAVTSVFTPLMTRKTGEIDGSAPAPHHEFMDIFSKTSINSTGPGFSESWNSITSVGDNFAFQMYDTSSISSMDTGFNLPQGITEVGDYFAQYMFYDCRRLTAMNQVFNLPQGIETVGDYFASYIFTDCSSLEKMNDVFNLPQGITEVGDYFVEGMFYGCSNLSSMNAVFNLPQGITEGGDDFVVSMFYDCSNLSSMNDVFNLPQGITEVGNYFAYGMFNGCSSLEKMNAVFNLPQGITTVGNYFAYAMFRDAGTNVSPSTFTINSVFRFPKLNPGEVVKDSVFSATFSGVNFADNQSRSLQSIINGNETPSVQRNTFNGATEFVDYNLIANLWGGLTTPVTPNATVTFVNNDPTHTATMPIDMGAVQGEKIGMPYSPQVTGHTVTKWYKDAALSDEWDFATDIVLGTTLTLYAGWARNTHNIVGEQNPTFTQGLEGVITSDAEYADYQETRIDGQKMEVVAREGSTIITLSGALTQSLAVGQHTIEIESTTGIATTTFNIVAAPPVEPVPVPTEPVAPTQGGSPSTGDNSVALWMMIAMAVAVSGVVLVRRKTGSQM